MSLLSKVLLFFITDNLADFEEVDIPLTSNTISPLSANDNRMSSAGISSSPHQSPEPQHRCCIAKFYDSMDSDPLRMNDMIEIIGIYHNIATSGCTLTCEDSIICEEDDCFDSLAVDRLPSSSFCPRIHCLAFRRLGCSFPFYCSPTTVRPSDPLLFSPLYRRSDSRDSYSGIASNMLADADNRALLETRGKIISLLMAALSGDALCAEYLLLAALSGAVSSSGNSHIVLRMLDRGTEAERAVLQERVGFVLSHILPRIVEVNSSPFLFCKILNLIYCC